MADPMAERPQRIQRKRTAGWRMPEGAVYVGRQAQGGMWGNWVAKRQGLSGTAAVAAFRHWVENEASDAWKGRARIELGGRTLACWCRLDRPCHADVLIDLVNNLACDSPRPEGGPS